MVLSSPGSSNWPGIALVACAILRSSLRVEWKSRSAGWWYDWEGRPRMDWRMVGLGIGSDGEGGCDDVSICTRRARCSDCLRTTLGCTLPRLLRPDVSHRGSLGARRSTPSNIPKWQAHPMSACLHDACPPRRRRATSGRRRAHSAEHEGEGTKGHGLIYAEPSQPSP